MGVTDFAHEPGSVAYYVESVDPIEVVVTSDDPGAVVSTDACDQYVAEIDRHAIITQL